MFTTSSADSRFLLGALLYVLITTASAQTLLTIGDSITSGFPHDAVGYQSKLNDVLDPDPTYVGGQLGDPFVMGAGTIPIVGGDGYFISKAPVVGGPEVSAVFSNDGMLEAVNNVSGIAAPEYIVVLGGVNDLLQLISPSGGLDSFSPSIAGDFTSSGTFTDDDGVNPSVDYPVDSLIFRYEALLDSLAAAYPTASEIICLPIPPIDPAGSFVTRHLTSAEAWVLATNVVAFNLQLFDSSGPSGLVHTKGDRFSFVDPALLATDILDGLHPTAGGHEKIGDAVRAFITNGNTAPVIDAIPAKIVDELATLSFTATVTDADGGDSHTFSLGDGAIAGAAITTAGAFTWTPTEENGPGVYEIPIIVTDDGAGTLNHGQFVSVEVVEVNTPPTLENVPDQTATVDVELMFTVNQGQDVDLPAQALTYELDGSAPSGASITPEGTFTWTPDLTQGGATYTFDIIVKDPSAASDSDEISIEVADANVNPVFGAVPGTVAADELVEVSFEASVTDADVGNTFTFSLEAIDGKRFPTGATLTPSAMGDSVTFAWTPTEAQGPGTGDDTFFFELVVTDNAFGKDGETVKVLVFETNQPPTFPMVGDRTIDEGVELVIDLQATDPDVPAQALNYGLPDGKPVGATIDENGIFRWTPLGNQGGASIEFDIAVQDDGSGRLVYRETVTFTVNNVNVAPTLDPIANRNLGRESTLRFFATGRDTDEPADTLTYRLENAPAGAAIDSTTGEFRWTPSAGQGNGLYTFDVFVSDGSVEATQEVEITVVDPELYIMTMGDSITAGLPHNNDGISYHTFLDQTLPMPATYVGETSSRADSGRILGNPGDGGAPIVGGDGIVISQTPSEAFSNPGIQEGFNVIKDSVIVPNFVVVMAGMNDLMLLIAPADMNESFAPSVAEDYTSSGIFNEFDGMNSTQHDVDAIIDRYRDLLLEVAEQFPPSTKIIAAAISPVDVDSDPGFGGEGSQFDRARIELATAVPVFNSQIQKLVGVLGDRFSYVDPALSVTPKNNQILDGLHPTNDGYEQIGVAFGNFINANDFPVLDEIGNQTVAELENLQFTATSSDPSGHDRTFSLSANAPVGAMIDEVTGLFSWTPTAAQGPASYTFDVIVTDNGPGNFCDSERLTIEVTGDDPYDTWLAANFSTGDLNDPDKEAAVWGRHANPDGGEWVNEFEFYLGTDPNVDDEPDYEVMGTATGAKVVYMKLEDAPLGFVDIEWSTDMVNWFTTGITHLITGAASDGKEPAEAEITSSSDRVFFQFVSETP